MELCEPVDKTRVRFRGRTLIYFGGCDYFRLSRHPRVTQAIERGLKRWGLNVSASRATTGNHPLYKKLESSLGNYFRCEAAVCVGSGYLGNLVAAQAMAGEFSMALLDERAHPALRDAARALACPLRTFRHRDPGSMSRLLRKSEARPIVLTDGMFSHDGSIAPLREYLDALPQSGRILVDDAHGAGLLGPNGRGTPELSRVSRAQIIQTITLSKAFGIYGGAILGSRALTERIRDRSRAYIGSTPLPLPLTAAALVAVQILARDPSLRRQLERNCAYFDGHAPPSIRRGPTTPNPIFGLVPETTASVRQHHETLLKHGIFPSFIKYPGGPASGYFRFVLSSAHTRKQLDALAGALAIALRTKNQPRGGSAVCYLPELDE